MDNNILRTKAMMGVNPLLSKTTVANFQPASFGVTQGLTPLARIIQSMKTGSLSEIATPKSGFTLGQMNPSSLLSTGSSFNPQ